MFTLAHLTDLHLGPLPQIRRRDLASKRLFGYINWQRNRSHKADDQILAALVDDIRAQQPDHIVVTGDLVNLALREEFVAAGNWLKQLGYPDRITVVPGNHDAYVPGALRHALEAWRDFMTDDDDVGNLTRFPFIRRRGPAAIIGLNSAIATAPFMATGRIGADQVSACGKHLDTLEAEGLFRIVLIHHPPIIGSTGWNKRLIGAGLFRAEIARRGAELVLYGHNHKTHVSRLTGKNADVPVVGGTAASLLPRPDRTGGAYNLFQIEGSRGAFTCTMTERGIRHVGGAVEPLGEHRLIGKA